MQRTVFWLCKVIWLIILPTLLKTAKSRNSWYTALYTIVAPLLLGHFETLSARFNLFQIILITVTLRVINNAHRSQNGKDREQQQKNTVIDFYTVFYASPHSPSSLTARGCWLEKQIQKRFQDQKYALSSISELNSQLMSIKWAGGKKQIKRSSNV